MRWSVFLIIVLTFAAILVAPFLIKDNALAQALFGLISTAIATAVGVYASWRYSQNSDKERLTRYGLLAWRNIDALSVKVRQQIQQGSARTETLESWLLDIDGAKWAWRDLLREVFELQERLTLEKEEVSLEYKNKINSASNEGERAKLENELRLKMAQIRTKAPLPIAEEVTVNCPNCGAGVGASLGSEPGSTAWPQCVGCRALFPVHRKSEGEVTVNPEVFKLPAAKDCPYCNSALSWMVPAHRSVHFLYRCPDCEKPIQCDGSAADFTATRLAAG